jgi:hypothetical protein
MRAIRIIRDPGAESDYGPSNLVGLASQNAPVSPVTQADRERQRLAVTEVLLQSLKDTSPERIASCKDKLKIITSRIREQNFSYKNLEQLFHKAESPGHIHAELDISRVLELLED